MARQKGHIKYVGTLGDVRHFKVKGNKGFYAGLVGGPTGEQVKNSPSFVRTRENMSEFAACAMAGKSVRVGLSSLMRQMSDSQLTGRLTAIMKKINIEDGSEARGQRAVLISQQPQYLKGLDFNRNISFNGVFNAPYTLTSNVARNETVLNMTYDSVTINKSQFDDIVISKTRVGVLKVKSKKHIYELIK